MAPMHRPGTTAVLDDQAGFEAESVQVAAITRAASPEVAGAAIQATGAKAVRPAGPGVAVPALGQNAATPVTITGIPSGRVLPCTDDPDLFFAESPEDVECAKDLCRSCPARMACLAGALERREPWGVWGGELFLRGEIVPRKRPRGRPRKDEVAA
jgi:WhiB family transcriptional regulator, redox-sensing transcriptional regulator